MRRTLFLLPLLLLVSPTLKAQDPASLFLGKAEWPFKPDLNGSAAWAAFTSQYYSVSNWNVSGLTFTHLHHHGSSSILVAREGIPGFSWYHMSLSHAGTTGSFSGMLQVRLTLLTLKDHRDLFRASANFVSEWCVNEQLTLRCVLFDFPGWLFTAPTIRGDPRMDFLIWYEPGRMAELVTGFSISPARFGGLKGGVRVRVADQVRLSCTVALFPLALSVGFFGRVHDYDLTFCLEQRSGMGPTPTIQISHGL